MYVKLKHAGQFFIVKICEPESDDFTPDGITISIVNKLKLDIEGRELLFKDRDGAKIYFDELPGTILQYRCSSSFFIQFCLDENTTSTNSRIIKKDLESYLKSGDFSALFSKYSGKQTLSDSSRRGLVRESINFLRQRSGNYPSREDKFVLAEAIIDLFPAFKVENSDCGGIDLFFNPDANTGYLVAKLKNFNSKRRKLSTASANPEKKTRKS